MNPLVVRPPMSPSRDVASPASLVELLVERVAESFERPAVVDPLAAVPPGAPRPAWTWGDLAAAALHLADALAAAGLRPGDRIAHVGPHAPDWIALDLACLTGGFVHVAIHADMQPADRARIVRWLGARGVVTGGGERWSGDAGGAAVLSIERLGGLDDGAWRGLAADRRRLEATLRHRAAACDPDACATILLSSGTTGEPHGVLHSQRALAANAAAAADVFLDDPRDVRLAWLPMSHAFARTGDLATALVRGGCLSVVGDRMRVLEACAALPPTVILGVPAFFERLEQAVRSRRIGDLAAALGGRVRACVSGGAPLRRRTADFFAARGVPLVEGYGLAEAGPVVTVSNPRIARPGTVGPPLDGVEVRIDDRPESRGQVLVRTPSLALGVIEPPDPAVRPAAREGWLETGDVGAFDDAGHLQITGRLRDVVVLASGAKIPPAVVERALADDEHVAQVCVVGDGLPWPVALVVPEPVALRAALGRLGARVASRRAALGHPRLLAWLARRMARRQRDLPRAWQVRRLVLVGRPFDAAHGEATAALKLVRRRVAENFRDRVAAAALPAPPAWAAVVPAAGPRRAAVAAPSSPRPWLAGAVWQGDHGGFAEAAGRAASAQPDRVAAIVAEAERVIGALGAADALYDAPAGPAPAPAPLDDAPVPSGGTFSRAAEEALGRAGLWGLAVPVEHGGAGASHLDLVQAITRLAFACPTAAGMLAVHSSIGAVSALTAFGSAEQRARHLPGLAAGRPLSVFGGTEPDAGCDLGAVRAALERRDGRLVLTGTKMFITGATHGRLVKVLARRDGSPAVALVRLPEADGPTFRLLRYALHPLKHAHNAALEFTAHPVDETDLLAAPGGDAMRIVWHGLDRGRGTLAAQAAGTLRLLLAQARSRALERSTWGRPIASRELVQGRLGRIAAGIAACDAVAAWAAAAVDAGGGELEAIAAKVTASTCVREAALDALGVHGGRAFLVGHPLGDGIHDHLAVTVYEGESDLLGLALLKGIAKRHPLAGPAAGAGWRRAGAWLAWRTARLAAAEATDRSILDRPLREHARRARRLLARAAARIDAAIRRHGRGLAERQLEVGALAADVRELVSVLAVAHHADAAGGDAVAAECWCRFAIRRVGGGRPSVADHAALAALGARVASDPAVVPAP